MKIEQEKLLDDLKKMTQECVVRVKNMRKTNLNKLNFKANPESWSALECIEHLNLYSDYYLPELEKKISASTKKKETNFKSGWMGNYFANMMYNPNKKPKKMKTFDDKDPKNSKLTLEVIERFLDHQSQLIERMESAAEISLRGTWTNISISTWFKLRLGDTLRVVVYHQMRHIVQAQNAVNDAIRASK